MRALIGALTEVSIAAQVSCVRDENHGGICGKRLLESCPPFRSTVDARVNEPQL